MKDTTPLEGKLKAFMRSTTAAWVTCGILVLLTLLATSPQDQQLRQQEVQTQLWREWSSALLHLLPADTLQKLTDLPDDANFMTRLDRAKQLAGGIQTTREIESREQVEAPKQQRNDPACARIRDQLASSLDWADSAKALLKYDGTTREDGLRSLAQADRTMCFETQDLQDNGCEVPQRFQRFLSMDCFDLP